MKNKLSGFTLVEIMVVIAVLLVILAISGPGLLRSRLIANESAALANLRSAINACQLFNMNRDQYPAGLTDLIEPTSSPSYIDPVLATGRKQSYDFVYALVNENHFTLRANPVSVGLLRGRFFYTDETGVIHGRTGRQAGPNDPIVF